MYDTITYIIPGRQAINLGAFFVILDAKLDELKIKSYSVEMCSLEDVFLRLKSDQTPDLFGDLRHLMEDD